MLNPLHTENGSRGERQVEAEPLSFERWLAWRMACLDLSAPELATLVGVVDQTVYNWLSGFNKPYRKRFRALIEVLDVTPEVFARQLGLTKPEGVIPRRWAKLMARAQAAGPEAETMVLNVASTMLDHWE
jgi:DNA-binding transcriptional regulator YiaG